MVKITIIGWYGTETIGDRAILAGLLSILKEVTSDMEINLGCLYPFFTERTILEDEVFFRQCIEYDKLPISLFDSSKPKELDAAIKDCDWLIIGGGPLEDIPSMFMLEYAMIKAKKLKKRTLILGCGIGPLYKWIYQKSMLNIVEHADICIFRDDRSRLEYERLSSKRKMTYTSIDPAVFAIQIFKQYYPVSERKNNIIVSIRSFPPEYKINKSIDSIKINQILTDLICKIAQDTGQEIKLLPMHYWGIGDDDRYFMNTFCWNKRNLKFSVQNDPLNTVDTMKQFAEASFCVGMRYHAVVFQTLLNGRNIILDYTDPQTGKIVNFLTQIGANACYQQSYMNLQISSVGQLHFPEKMFIPDLSRIHKFRELYISYLKSNN